MTNATTITANPGELWVDIDRVVDAPVDGVFAAYTEQDLIAKWLGPRGYVMDVTAFDPRDGGEWAFTHITPSGGAIWIPRHIPHGQEQRAHYPDI